MHDAYFRLLDKTDKALLLFPRKGRQKASKQMKNKCMLTL